MIEISGIRIGNCYEMANGTRFQVIAGGYGSYKLRDQDGNATRLQPEQIAAIAMRRVDSLYWRADVNAGTLGEERTS